MNLRRVPRILLCTAALALASCLSGCGPSRGCAVFSMKMAVAPGTPGDASVTIDEEYVGPLSVVAARGVKMCIGTHRVTVEKEGYFPWDQLIEGDRETIHLDVKLTPIPD